MSKDKIEVNMNVYDIPIVVEVLEEANKEIERLNNIINTIEQYCLDEQIPEEYPDYNDFTEIFNSIYDTIYNKIQELKGSDTNE